MLLTAVIVAYYTLGLPEDEESANPSVSIGDARESPSSDSVGVGPRLVVTQVKGTAERLSQGSAQWVSVRAGDELAADEKLRTGKDAAVRLAVDEKSHFELAGRSELSVKELTETVHQIDLVLGKIDVDYEISDNRILKIVALDEGDAVAETNAARFVVQNVDGEVTVAAKMGKVKLTAKAETVVLGPDMFSRVSRGEAPRKPEPIPVEVLLKVANPKRNSDLEKSTMISGKTDIGAMLEIDDEPVSVDKTGRFKTAIPLVPGRNRVEVVSTTAWGRAERHVPIINTTDSAEITDAKVKWGKADGVKKKASSP